VNAPGGAVLSREGLDDLIEALIARGYRVIGPTRRDDAIVLDEITSAAQLPAGWGVDSAPGRYRLRRRDDVAVFGHSAGSQSWKQFLHPARQRLVSVDGFTSAPREPVRYAFLGVRACDLTAIAVLGTASPGRHALTSALGGSLSSIEANRHESLRSSSLRRTLAARRNSSAPSGSSGCSAMAPPLARAPPR